MPKKQTDSKYPKGLFVHTRTPDTFIAHDEPGAIMNLHDLEDGAEVATYKFDRLAKVKRTVTVE